MTFDEQLPAWSDVAQIAVGDVVIYLLLISCSRIIGPRSFSQMTAFDFAVAVAMGAIVGSTATGGIPVYAGALGMVCPFAVRGVVAISRRHGLDRWFDNRPILFMAGFPTSSTTSCGRPRSLTGSCSTPCGSPASHHAPRFRR